MVAFFFIFRFYHAAAAIQITLQQAVHHHIRITTDGRGEMCIIFKGQTIVADIFCRITGFLHRTDSQCLDQVLFRLIVYFIQQTVQVA